MQINTTDGSTAACDWVERTNTEVYNKYLFRFRIAKMPNEQA